MSYSGDRGLLVMHRREWRKIPRETRKAFYTCQDCGKVDESGLIDHRCVRCFDRMLTAKKEATVHGA